MDNLVSPSTSSGNYPWQTTISKQKSFNGIGLHSGNLINVTFKPAKENTGIIFIRTDIDKKIKERSIKALYSNVSDTSLCTTIENEYGIKVSTIEHLMAAFNGTGIDNIIIELNGPEVPIMDGSSLPLIEIIENCGIESLKVKRKILKILKKIEVSVDNKYCSFVPSKEQKFSVEIDFENKAVGKQSASTSLANYNFKNFASNARTFGFMKDVEYMRSQGLGLGGSIDNCIIVDNNEIINPEGLRHENEFSRHKLLDAVGDIYTSGYRIQGSYKGLRCGHYINNLLLHELFKSNENYEIFEYLDPPYKELNRSIESNYLVS
tara:strand:+ start:2447 stop:3409 length:963 start_codon:yes stop_codon:yes gene_type:complete